MLASRSSSPESVPLRGDDVELLLELGDADDGLGGAVLGSLEPRGEPATLPLGDLGADDLGGEAFVGLDHLGCGIGQSVFEPADRGVTARDPTVHVGDEDRVLGSAGLGELAVGLGLAGTVAGGLAAGVDELGVGDPGGGDAEEDAGRGSDRDDEPRAAEGCAGDGQGSEDEQHAGNGHTGGPLATPRGLA